MAPQHWLVFGNKVSGFGTDNAMSIYTNMMDEKNDDVRGMLVFLEIMMKLSSTTAACERGLSCMNLQKMIIHTYLSS